LHSLLEDARIRPLVHGGKGVGSGGDGPALLLAKDEESQRETMAVIESELGMKCIALTLRRKPTIRKAVIPAAGLGTRLFPATKAVKKEFFPVLDSDMKIKPAIQHIVEEAIDSGIENVCIVVQERDLPLFSASFQEATPGKVAAKLSPKQQQLANRILEIGGSMSFAVQHSQECFGHVVYCGREWVGREPFVLLLGDHLYYSSAEESCISQLLRAYETHGENVLGL
jgi:UTP-glucose-1-phosphate uridylyltransferase